MAIETGDEFSFLAPKGVAPEHQNQEERVAWQEQPKLFEASLRGGAKGHNLAPKGPEE